MKKIITKTLQFTDQQKIACIEDALSDLTPESRMAAIGLLVKILTKEESTYANCFITSPDGTVISYADAVCVFENMICDYVAI